MFNRRDSPLPLRPQVHPWLWFPPLLDRMPQYRDWADPGCRGQNYSFWQDAGI